MQTRHISRLSLHNFRSHPSLNWELDARPVIITGANGAGKTNILEAISLFTPGRGLRRANASSLPHKKGDGTWVASITVEGSFAPVQLGTGVERGPTGQRTRVVHIDGQPEASIAACNQHLSILWLTPDMDRLLRDTPAERRKFLDRLALSLFPQHAQTVMQYEKLMQSRLRLLSEYNYDATWLNAIEAELATAAVQMATTRTHIISLLKSILFETRDLYAPLPWADVWLDSAYDKLLATLEPEEYEPYTRNLFYDNRIKDAKSGRTLSGPHLTDVCVMHGTKNCLAQEASTGEQKALLLRLILAHARLLAQEQGFKPIILLDEVCAHLDPKRRAAVLEALEDLGVQAWLTGTDAEAYGAWVGKANFIGLEG